jgi:hypothetical protein
VADLLSTRDLLRLYQAARRDVDVEQLDADLQLLQNKDLDLSIRLGAILAFDALLINAAIQPIAASPGAPLSVDAGTAPLATVATAIAVALLAASAFIAVRAITMGEEFRGHGLDEKPAILVQRLYAAYCRSIDRQRGLLVLAIRLTLAGLGLAALTFAAILGLKLPL